MTGDKFLLVIFLLAHGLAAVLLPWPRRSLPLLWQGPHGLFASLEERLNREKRSGRARYVRGIVAAAVVMLLAWFITGSLVLIAQRMTYGWIIILLLFSALLFPATPWRVLRLSAAALDRGDRARAVALLQPLLFLRTLGNGADSYDIARKAVEMTAWALHRGIVGPVFWFYILGLPGAALYVSVAAMRLVVPDGMEGRVAFGWPVSRLDDVVDFLPARLTAILIAAAAFFVASCRPGQALALAQKHGRFDESLNEGWPVAAMAGALGVTLGGPLQIEAQPSPLPRKWVGAQGTSARLQPADVRKALHLHIVSLCLILGMILLSLRV